MDNNRRKILIVDDSEYNRALLVDILSQDFEIIEAANGREALVIIQEKETEIALMLLDIVMPVMDGFEVLSTMREKGWIESIPVIMISAESGNSYIDRAYDLGAIDYISRPFDERTVKHRVLSNFMFTAKQKQLSDMLTSQIYEKEKDNNLMIEILSHIVEFRNGESGLHVLHVHAITEMLLKELVKITDKYVLTPKDIRLISNASALHDIGKISIPNEILNKPGRLTPEEFAVMKTHTLEGAKILENLPFHKNEQLVTVSYQICRWHHERYDGRGYPDGLKGDEIPIAAQVVALADVYDALTAKRIYKAAYDPDEAVRMINNGECGQFNPLLIECLAATAGKLKEMLTDITFGQTAEDSIYDAVQEILVSGGSDVSSRTVRALNLEKMRNKYLAALMPDVIFEYVSVPPIIKMSKIAAEHLGLSEAVLNPYDDEDWGRLIDKGEFKSFVKDMKATTIDNPSLERTFVMNIGGKKVRKKITCLVLWAAGDSPEFEGAVGKITDAD